MIEIKKICKNKSFNQLSVMILLTIVTQVFMLLKGSLIAAKFGISTDLDAFNFANSIAGFAYSFIGSGISTILMPNLSDDNNKRSINTFISVLYTSAFLILIFMIIFRKSLISILSGSSNSYFVALTSNILIITLVVGFLNSFLGLVNGVLQYKGQFNRLKVVTLFTSILLFFILLFGKDVNIYYYVISILITTIINIIINLYFLISSGFKYSISFKVREKRFKEMIKLFIPTVLGEGLYRISLVIDTLISSRLGSGQVSILNYSNTVISMINILLLGNITSFIYPRLINTSRNNKSQDSLFKYITLINFIMCLIVVLFFISGKESIIILYQRGNFNSENTKIVYFCSLIYILSLPVNAIRDLMYKYFYINDDTYTIFKNSIVISILNILISIVLSNYIGLYGIVLGTVVTSYLSLIFISIKFKNKFRLKVNSKHYFYENIKIILNVFVSVSIVNVIKRYLIINNVLLSIIVYSIVSLIVFLSILKVFKSKILKLS